MEPSDCGPIARDPSPEFHGIATATARREIAEGLQEPWVVVKVGDTESDVHEGRNAGMWTIGLTRSGNSVGLTEDEWAHLDPDEQSRLLTVAGEELRQAGAHYTAESVAHILPILDEIEQRIAQGELPR